MKRARRHDFPNGCAAFELASEGARVAALGLARCSSSAEGAMYDAARHLAEAARHLQAAADLANNAAAELRERAERGDPAVLWLFEAPGPDPADARSERREA